MSVDRIQPGKTDTVLDVSFRQEMAQRMLPDISQAALKDNEWANHPETQAIIKRDQQIIAADPDQIHLRFLIGPSIIGKTTIASQMARVNERDGRFRQVLNKQRRVGVPSRNFFGIHISLSEALNQAAKEAGFSKDDITEAERQVASQRIIDAIEVIRNTFTGDPEYTIGVYVDTVGITQADLGRTALEHYVNDPYTRFFFPDPNEEVENDGLEIRRMIADLAQKRLRRHGSIPNANQWLKKTKHMYSGIDLRGREKKFVESCGKEEAWRRQWGDILMQMRGKIKMDNEDISLDAFLKDFDRRREYYLRWLPQRQEELGIDHFTLQSEILPNPHELKSIHTHFDRLYIDPHEVNRPVYHFPMSLLGPNQELSTLTKTDVLQAMGVIPQLEQQFLYLDL